ncbi:MAG: hypothetical protein BGO72_06455 [Burkholderiales bacterium 70-64]|nr:MAG: hypothetical protein BGO72_06455 [Burkholderiales bacterium 70-64]
MATTPFPLPIALTPADRRALRARAHHLDPVVMIGDAGLSRAVLAEADRALGAHGLIKIRVLGDDREQRQTLLAEICSALGCTAVQSIGKLLIVYRPRPIEDTERARGPRVPAKRAAETAAAPRKPRTARTSMRAMKVAAAAAKPARTRKSAPLDTEGKHTAVGARARLPARKGTSSAATQGPSHLQGRVGPARAGTRARGKKG